MLQFNKYTPTKLYLVNFLKLTTIIFYDSVNLK